MAEPMARMGAEVTAIDMTEEGLEVARRHAELDPVVMERVEYR